MLNNFFVVFIAEADVTVDKSGRIVYLHRNLTPFDRPSLDLILQAIKKHKEKL